VLLDGTEFSGKCSTHSLSESASFISLPRLRQVVAFPSDENLISPLSSVHNACWPAAEVTGSAATL